MTKETRCDVCQCPVDRPITLWVDANQTGCHIIGGVDARAGSELCETCAAIHPVMRWLLEQAKSSARGK